MSRPTASTPARAVGSGMERFLHRKTPSTPLSRSSSGSSTTSLDSASSIVSSQHTEAELLEQDYAIAHAEVSALIAEPIVPFSVQEQCGGKVAQVYYDPLVQWAVCSTDY